MVVGLFVFILYGLISFGLVLATKQQVTNAAADAARAAVGQTDDAAAIAAATARVDAALTAGNYTLDPPISVSDCGSNKCITVTILYNLEPAPGLGLVIPPTTTAKSVVQYA